MSSWRPQGGPAVRPLSRRLAIRPQLLSLEDRAVPSTVTATDPVPVVTTAPPTTTTTTTPAVKQMYAVGADVGNQPLVQVYNPDGSLKYSIMAYNATYRGGVRVAIGDVTGDAVPDIVTAPGPGMAGQIKVFDGTSGAEVANFMAYNENFKGGVYVAVADVNDDGHADIITGAGAGGGPHVRVFDGTWVVPPVHAVPTTPTTPTGTTTTTDPTTTTSGTTNTDPTTTTSGTPTTPVTAPTTPTPAPVTPAVGLPPGVLNEFFAYNPYFTGGVRVAAGDVNGDGHADIITGAGPGGGPHVRVYDGLTGQILHQFYAFASTYTGGVYVSAGDIVGDGKAELLVGSGTVLAQVKVYDNDSTLLRTFTVNDPMAYRLGVRVAMADVDGDGKEELLLAVGTSVQARDPLTNATKETTAPFDPTILGGVFVG